MSYREADRENTVSEVEAGYEMESLGESVDVTERSASLVTSGDI